MMHGKLQNNKVLKRLFFKLLPVQIVLFGMGSINSIIDGTIAGFGDNDHRGDQFDNP